MKNGLKITNFGTKFYYKNDELHRDDGPSIEYINEDKHWFKNGKLHREDGPAIERTSGKNLWYYNGKYIDVLSQEEFEKYLKMIIFI